MIRGGFLNSVSMHMLNRFYCNILKGRDLVMLGPLNKHSLCFSVSDKKTQFFSFCPKVSPIVINIYLRSGLQHVKDCL